MHNQARILTCLGLLAACLTASLAAAQKPRYAVVTDMTHDDGNSLIRLLYYGNEIDLQAIVVAPQEPDFKWNSDGPWKKAQSILDGYAKVYDLLKRHDPAYPTPDYLRSITQRGHGALPIIWLSEGQKVDGWLGAGHPVFGHAVGLDHNRAGAGAWPCSGCCAGRFPPRCRARDWDRWSWTEPPCRPSA